MRFKDWVNLWLLLAPDGTGGGSGDNGSDDGDDEDDETSNESYQRLLSQHQNADNLARNLHDRNYKLRGKNRALRSRLAELERTERTDGSLVLTKEQAEQFRKLSALNMSPEDLQTAVTERGQFQGELTKLQRQATLRDMATVAGYNYAALRDADDLATVRDGKSLTYSVRDEQKDGKPIKVVYVKDGTTEVPLHDFATSNWATLLPSLMVSQSTGTQGGGTPYPSQHQGTQGNQPTTASAQTHKTLDSAYKEKPKTT